MRYTLSEASILDAADALRRLRPTLQEYQPVAAASARPAACLAPDVIATFETIQARVPSRQAPAPERPERNVAAPSPPSPSRAHLGGLPIELQAQIGLHLAPLDIEHLEAALRMPNEACHLWRRVAPAVLGAVPEQLRDAMPHFEVLFAQGIPRNIWAQLSAVHRAHLLRAALYLPARSALLQQLLHPPALGLLIERVLRDYVRTQGTAEQLDIAIALRARICQLRDALGAPCFPARSRSQEYVLSLVVESHMRHIARANQDFYDLYGAMADAMSEGAGMGACLARIVSAPRYSAIANATLRTAVCVAREADRGFVRSLERLAKNLSGFESQARTWARSREQVQASADLTAFITILADLIGQAKKIFGEDRLEALQQNTPHDGREMMRRAADEASAALLEHNA
jgi:hypothetical protein